MNYLYVPFKFAYLALAALALIIVPSLTFAQDDMENRKLAITTGTDFVYDTIGIRKYKTDKISHIYGLAFSTQDREGKSEFLSSSAGYYDSYIELHFGLRTDFHIEKNYRLFKEMVPMIYYGEYRYIGSKKKFNKGGGLSFYAGGEYFIHEKLSFEGKVGVQASYRENRSSSSSEYNKSFTTRVGWLNINYYY